jgi:hypothetical protein
MSTAMPMAYPAQVSFAGDGCISRWRPLVQWLLAVPHLAIVAVLRRLRQLLTLISLVSVVFTKRIPRPVFGMIAMTYRYEWRSLSYVLFMHEDYPPFAFAPSADDDAVESHTTLTITYPEHLNRWKPLYKWFLAIPHYLVVIALTVAGCFAFLGSLFAVLVTGRYPQGIRDFIIGVYRYTLRVEAYVGLLTDTYPPFRLTV